MGFFDSESTTRVQNYPDWAKQYLQSLVPMGQSLAADYTSGNAATARNNSYDQLFKTLRGDYLSPTTNPYWSSLTNAIQRQSQEYLNNNLNSVSQRGVATGGLLGSKAAQQKAATTRTSMQDLTDKLNALGANLYNTERGNQVAATGTGLQYGYAPAQQAQSLGQFLSSLESTQTSETSASPFSALTGVLGGLSSLSSLAGPSGVGGWFAKPSELQQAYTDYLKRLLKSPSAVSSVPSLPSVSPFTVSPLRLGGY